MTEWESAAKALADQLAAEGELRSVEWKAAFANTPRHVFVPRWYERRGVLVDAASFTGTERWMRAVYADTALITQQKPNGENISLPTSSSTMPSIMAWMLEALDVRDGQRVLEIGTGTGYNAALLCHRLGSSNVVSVDIDPALVALAGERLAGLGHTPALVTGDGSRELPDLGSFDRIISTASVDHIPPLWIERLASGGVLVTDLRGSISGGIAVLRRTGDGLVSGFFGDVQAVFMPLRPHAEQPLHRGSVAGAALDPRNPHTGHTEVDPSLIAQEPDFRFLLQLHLPTVELGFFTTDSELIALSGDERWARVALAATEGGYRRVTQGGATRLWDSAEVAHRLWQAERQPGPPPLRCHRDHGPDRAVRLAGRPGVGPPVAATAVNRAE